MNQIGEPFIPYQTFKHYSFIPNVLSRHNGLSCTAKICWARLAQYAGKDGKCYPSQKQLAQEIGISESQIKRVLKELEEQGFIKKIHPRGNDRFAHKTVRYQFLWHRIFEEESKGSTTGTSGGSENATPRRIASDPSGGSADELSKEKGNNKQKKKEKKTERDADKKTASPLSSSLSSSEIIKTAEKHADDVIRKKAQVSVKNRIDCDHIHCDKYFACIEEENHHAIMTSCPVLLDKYIAVFAKEREKLIAEKVEELEEKNITDPAAKVKRVVEHFVAATKENRGVKYMMKPRDKEAVAKYLNFSEKPNYKRLIEYYLNPRKCKKSEEAISLSACLSEDTINRFQTYKNRSKY